MQLSRDEAERLAREGAAALRSGDAARARQSFEAITGTGRAPAQIWLALAEACRGCGDGEGEERAIDGFLALEPRHLVGLIRKGDCRARAGDERAATSYYRAALEEAGRAGALPPQLAAEVKRVEAAVGAAGASYERHLERHLADAGFAPEGVSRRFGQALDILLQRKQIYFQQPSAFYFPELPQVQFYERERLPWVEKLEASTDAIREELVALLEHEQGFKPYVEPEPNRPYQEFHGLVGNPNWSAYYLIEDGEVNAANAERCPRTMAALAEVPLTRIPARTPSVLFSLLRPGTRIPPHSGMLNVRLICHLPLVVPPGCAIRVGNETRAWETGRTLIFDDSFEHEAWNGSDRNRVILLFDVWRPELDEAERQAVAAMFEAIDGYGASAG